MSSDAPKRKPQAFRLDDPDLVVAPDILRREPEGPPSASGQGAGAAPDGIDEGFASPRMATTATSARGLRWGALLFGALSALGGLALTLTFARFVSIAFERSDWIGWTAFGLLGLALLAFLVITGREIAGLVRLRRLGRIKRDLEGALARGDAKAEARALEAIFANLGHRPELKWSLAQLSEHARGVNDPGDLARLADRDVMPSLDSDARRLVAASARRVSVVTALSPMAAITVGWVAVENLRLLRALATLYGGRPGFLAATKLARMVLVHIVATGGVALTDDLVGQFLGQDLVRRLSRRLGESVFNAALTARVGAAAIEVIRPLPFIAAPKVRARDFIAEIVRLSKGRPASGEAAKG